MVSVDNQKQFVNLVKVLFGLIIVAFTLSLFFRYPNGDEAILAEQSFWLQQIGYVKSLMFSGLGFGWEFTQYHYHKLFIVIGAVIINIIGVNETALRAFVLLFSIILVYYLKIFSKSDMLFTKEQLLLFFVLLFFQYHFFYFSFIFRPELPVVSLGFLSFYYLNEFLKIKRFKFLILAAILSALSALMHLNGLVFIVSGLILLLVNREFKFTIYFFLISGLFLLLYFFNIHNYEEFNLFIYQFTNDPNLQKSDFSFILKFMKILGEHQRYFHSPKEIVLSVFFFFALIINFKKLFKEHRTLIIYTISILISLAAIAHDKTDKYSLIYLPFIILIIIKSCYDIKHENKIIKTFIPILFTLYIFVNSIFIFSSIYNYEHLPEKNEQYSSLMPKKNVRVLTRESFFFNEIYNYSIVSILSFEYHWKRLNNTKASSIDFYNFANENNIHYILIENIDINRNLLEIIEFNKLKENDNFFGYTIKMKTNKFVLFEKTI